MTRAAGWSRNRRPRILYRRMRSALVFVLFGLFGFGTVMAVPAAATLPDGVVEVDLEADMGGVTLRQVQVIRTLIRAARIMDALYQQQVTGEGFYPADMSREEFAAWGDPAGASPYTVVRRNAAGALEAVPYHEAWPDELAQVARLLAQAAAITDDEALRHYLTQRARALITGDYRRAEAAWRAMRYSDLDVLIGPIHAGADVEFGLKHGFGAYVMLRDWAWGARLAAYTVFLPEVQQSLPVSAAFKAEVPDVDMKVAVYDLLFHAGEGAVRAAADGPGAAAESRLRLRDGPQRLQLRNVTRARFEAMVMPVAAVLLAPAERHAVSFDAFLLNAMGREMAHSLGMQETVASGVPVARALGEHAEVIEATKAAVLSLWLLDWLHARGELQDTTLAAHHASFLASTLHSMHADADGAAARANALVFNHLSDWRAIRRDAATGRYRIDPDALGPAVEALAAQVLTLQGSGDYDGAAQLIATMAYPRATLQADLERLAAASIPAAVIFRQGEELLGL